MSKFFTIGDVCRIVNEPAHVVNHAISRFGPDATARVGITRVWDAAGVEAIKQSLTRISRRRPRSPSGDAS
jgi:hypothetical protein